MLYPQWDFKSMVEHDHENIKNYKGLKNFRVSMPTKEGILNVIVETVTKDIAHTSNFRQIWKGATKWKGRESGIGNTGESNGKVFQRP